MLLRYFKRVTLLSTVTAKSVRPRGKKKGIKKRGGMCDHHPSVDKRLHLNNQMWVGREPQLDPVCSQTWVGPEPRRLHDDS